jgi:hypothetical protein
METPIRDARTGTWYYLDWHEGEIFEQLASQSQTECTALAIILKARKLALTKQEGVVVSLEWAYGAQSPREFFDLVQSRVEKLDGVFVGRASFEQLDGEEAASVAAAKEKHKDVDKLREDIRSGKMRIEDLHPPPDEQLRRILQEDDDSWWVFDGEMLDERQVWSVE